MKLLMSIVLLFSIAGCMGNKESQRTVIPTSGRAVDKYMVVDQTVAAVSDTTVNRIETNDMTSLLVFVWLIVAVVGTVILTMVFNRICTPKQSKEQSRQPSPIYQQKHVIREQNNNKQ
jgi:hypothetical protein